MKVKHTLFFISIVILSVLNASGQKSRETMITVIRQDSIKKILKNFGESADLVVDPGYTPTFPTPATPNEDGKRIFLNLFANPTDTCIYNYLDSTRLVPGQVIQKADTLYKIRTLPALTPLNYMKMINSIFTTEGTDAKLDTNSVNVINSSERKIFNRKYEIDAFADFSFQGWNDILGNYITVNGKTLWFTISYEKISLKNQTVIRNVKISKVQPRPSFIDTTVVDLKYRFSIEPFLQVGVSGSNHRFSETMNNELTGLPGLDVSLGGSFVRAIQLENKEDKKNKYLDVGVGLGYSMLSLPIKLENYELVQTGLTPPFQPSQFFKEYNYITSVSEVKQNNNLGFISIPVFTRLRIPLKNNNNEAFFKLGIQTMVPIFASYRGEGKIHYTGKFSYVQNNQETILSTDVENANLASSIPDFNTLYGDKTTHSWESLTKSIGVTSKFETGISFKSGSKLKYFAGAYVSYRLAGLKYMNENPLTGSEGNTNSFLTKTDKVSPLGFGLTFSVSYDIYKIMEVKFK
jgi:hypothetical protein